ncbi:hypothetical protein EB796_005393 [Bugula neritina]|uniref:Uncharacterized protein n=1 Tax=Bugula neritina TaxID=10212 RepID=A0A7J7KEL3_BUGNE|nr:hypothetical protein EB796_005393 [Bugula neritina]
MGYNNSGNQMGGYNQQQYGQQQQSYNNSSTNGQTQSSTDSSGYSQGTFYCSLFMLCVRVVCSLAAGVYEYKLYVAVSLMPSLMCRLWQQQGTYGSQQSGQQQQGYTGGSQQYVAGSTQQSGYGDQSSNTYSGMKMENGYDQQSSGGGAVKNTTTYGGGQARTYAAPYSASDVIQSSWEKIEVHFALLKGQVLAMPTLTSIYE